MTQTKIYKSEAGKEEILSFYRKILEKWPVKHKRYFIDTKFGKTHVIDSAVKHNQTILMLHGSSSNSATWMADVKLWTQNYRTIALDFLGEPGLSQENRLPLTGNAYAEWLDEIVQYLSLKKISIIGMSLGAWCALKYATVFPEKVNKLVLIVPGGLAPQRISFTWKALLLMLQGDKGLNKLQKLVFYNVNVPQPVLDFGRLVAKHFIPITQPIPLFKYEELNKIKCPVQYFAGSKDPLLNTKKSAQRLKAAIPHAQINIFPNLGHAVLNQGEKIYQFLKNR